jgi:ADP-heptose:LPS heptosyltransferase
MQRMGDLILSFPLFLWLKRMYPDRPVWVVAEEGFYTGLMPLSPEVVYFPWTQEATGRLSKEEFSLVVNLSHRREAAELAADASAEEKVGPLAERGSVYVRGDWQLYRTSLTRNNLYNRFHWADLNALDVAPPEEIRATAFPAPRDPSVFEKKRVGLFLGASEPAKRPDAAFWAGLIPRLLDRGMLPVLLGGPAERELSAEVWKLSGAGSRAPDLAGRLGLAEFVYTGQGLALMVTPDTGPMHLAAWSGLAVLNLSMGPVNAHETGPYPPGHRVLRAALPCYGCWECGREREFCRELFDPERLAYLVHALCSGRDKAIAGFDGGDTVLCLSGRGENGLYELHEPDQAATTETAGLARFWRSYFGALFGVYEREAPALEMAGLAEDHPEARDRLLRAAAGLSRELSRALAAGGATLDADFWKGGLPEMRPVRGYIQMRLENEDYSRRAWRSALEMLDRIVTLAE